MKYEQHHNTASDDNKAVTENAPLPLPSERFVQQSRDVLFVRSRHDGKIVDANRAFLEKYRLLNKEREDSLFSFLGFELEGKTAFEIGVETAKGQPIIFRELDTGDLLLFHVFQHSNDFFLFGLNQKLPDTRATELLSSLTTDMGNLLREESRSKRKLSEIYAQVEELSRTDGLTGLLNHGYFMKRSDEILRHAERHGHPICLVMMDIDHFKIVNDKFGHLAGDSVLAGLGENLNNMTRAGDVSARYGGEEFVSLLQDSSLRQAGDFAERMRKSLEDSYPLGDDHPVTLSLGIAQYKSNESLEELVKRADDALYEAKKTRRNRVCVAS